MQHRPGDGHNKKQQGDKADAYIAAVKKAYPNDTKPTDLMDVDVMFRPGAVSQAKQKAALNAAPVYMYLFTWQSPVMDGKYKAVHCMEIPFVFNNIARCEQMTGGTKKLMRWLQSERCMDQFRTQRKPQQQEPAEMACIRCSQYRNNALR